MADYTGWILLGGGALAAVYLYTTGAFNGLLYPQQAQPMPYNTNMPMMPQMAGPDPSAQYDSYAQIPGIQALTPTMGIVSQAPTEYLLPVPTCPFDSRLYYNPSIWASNKIWEAQYNQVAQTIALRNQLALMRCGMVNFYNTIPIDVDFNFPLLHHISTSKRMIADEFHRGTRDSGRANSAALDAAQAVHPITTSHGHGSRPSSTNGPTPGENTPPIQAHALGSTKPVNAYYGAFSYQAVVPATSVQTAAPGAPYGGGTIAQVNPNPSPWLSQISGFTPGMGATTIQVTGQTLPTGGNYDQSRVIPCVTGDC